MAGKGAKDSRGGSGNKKPVEYHDKPVRDDARLESALDEIVEDQAHGGTSGHVVDKQPAQLAGSKRSYDQAVDSTFSLAPAPSDLSGRIVMARESEVQRVYKRGRLVDIVDLSPNPAPNIVLTGLRNMEGMIEEGHMLGQLPSLWQDKYNGNPPPTLVRFQELRTRRNRMIRSRPADVNYRKTGETEPVGPADEVGFGAPISVPAPLVPAQASAPAPAPAPVNAPAQSGSSRSKGRKERRRKTMQQRLQQDGQQEVQSGGNRAAICANCGKDNHVLADCPGPVDEEGFLAGCVVHNVMSHSYDECRVASKFSARQHVEKLILARAGLPPVRTSHSWPTMAFMPGVVTRGFPLTRAVSSEVSQEVIDAYDFENPAPLADDPKTRDKDALRKNIELLTSLECVHEAESIGDEDMVDLDLSETTATKANEPKASEAPKPKPYDDYGDEDEIDYSDGDAMEH